MSVAVTVGHTGRTDPGGFREDFTYLQDTKVRKLSRDYRKRTT